MRFINFTHHPLTDEQIEAARKIGATEIINAKDVLPNFAEITNDGGDNDSAYKAQKIAEAIVALAGKGPAIVHFPATFPPLKEFWRQYERWEFPTYADTQTSDYEIWKKVRSCLFVAFRFEKFCYFAESLYI